MNMLSVRRFGWSLIPLSAALLAGCESTGRSAGVAESRPAETQAEADPLAADQAGSMAGEDADRFRAPPGKRAPSRRPPETRQHRPVDQPRIRP